MARFQTTKNKHMGPKTLSPEPVYAVPAVSPRNESQREYLSAMRRSDVVFGIGPAGTGKTFLAAYEAASSLVSGDFKRIVICRPIVEAGGEKLGFLPGDLDAKCDPYLRPIYDGLQAVWHPKTIESYKSVGRIEVSPLAFMRGRTFCDSFVICDEAQNMSEDQMLMLLTRLGDGSRMVINGDADQRDRDVKGLEQARAKLSGRPNISFCDFTRDDVVRHETVRDILEAW